MEFLNSDSPYLIILKAASQIPISHYILGLLFIVYVFIYNFLEFHFFRDLFTGFRGQPVFLSFNSNSEFYRQVVSKCKVLHGRYLSTPWLSSPHIQTAFLTMFARAPAFKYTRQLFITPDGGTIALDWLMRFDCNNVMRSEVQVNDQVHKDDKNPIIIVTPGLTSDSEHAYLRHLAYKMAKRGFNVVVCNHRGLGGISITSDCFYNAGWTEDLRTIVDHIHFQYPQAPLFTVGLSVGANILVKYLGEEGVHTPICGAAAICSPWDLMICDRFLNRKLIQSLYNLVLATGLKGYAAMHHSVLSHIADFDGLRKSFRLRDFDHYATRLVGKYETVDTYYRRCTSATYVGTIAVPLLCINSFDDPVCTSEAIPWDECKVNENIVLARTQHGGHLAYFEGLLGNNIWWVRALDEYFNILQFTPFIHKKKEIRVTASTSPLESSIDHAPYLNVTEDHLVTVAADDPTPAENGENTCRSCELATQTEHAIDSRTRSMVESATLCTNQLSRQNRNTIWMLAYIAIITTCPLLGSALMLFFKKKK